MCTTIYGISNCDTVKKARKWFEQHHIEYQFHDFRKAGLSESQVNEWLKQVDWEILLNKRGTTWRQLRQSEKDSTNADTVTALLVANPTLVKRPVLTHGKNVLVGFNPSQYEQLIIK